MKLCFLILSTLAEGSYNPWCKKKSVDAATSGIVRINRFYSLVYSTVKLGITKTTALPQEMKIAGSWRKHQVFKRLQSKRNAILFDDIKGRLTAIPFKITYLAISYPKTWTLWT